MTYQDTEIIRDKLLEAKEKGIEVLDATRAVNRILHGIVQQRDRANG